MPFLCQEIEDHPLGLEGPPLAPNLKMVLILNNLLRLIDKKIYLYNTLLYK